jgi:hypothetical protein
MIHSSPILRSATIARSTAAYSTSGSPRICFRSFKLPTTSGSYRCSPYRALSRRAKFSLVSSVTPLMMFPYQCNASPYKYDAISKYTSSLLQ